MSRYEDVAAIAADTQTHVQICAAIDSAIAAGASGAEPPAEDNWLYRYWVHGNDLQASLCAAAAASVGEQDDPLLSRAVRKVVGERLRQIAGEGRTPESDDQYRRGELALAAMGFLQAFVVREQTGAVAARAPEYWPWDSAWFKPRSAEEDLARAAALAIAQLQNHYRREAAVALKRSEVVAPA